MKVKDVLFLPLRFFLSHDRVSSLGITSVLEERISVCAKYVKIPVLDVGCGEGNSFIRMKGLVGYGVDVFPFKHIDICADARHLPFKKESFQTVSFVGSFNYMKDSGSVLQEARRVLSDKGILLITVTGVFWSRLRHALAWWDKDQNVIEPEMKYGFSRNQLMCVLERNGFEVVETISYLMGISRLFIAQLKTQK